MLLLLLEMLLASSNDIKFAFLIPLTGSTPIGKHYVGAINASITQFRGEFPGKNISYRIIDTQYSPDIALNSLGNLIGNNSYVPTVIVGSGGEETCSLFVRLSYFWGIPMVSSSCKSDQLQIANSAFMTSSVELNLYITEFMILLAHFNWRNIGIIFLNTGMWSDTFTLLTDALFTHKVTILASESIKESIAANSFDLTSIVASVVQKSRIILILAPEDYVVAVCTIARNTNRFDSSYSFISFGFILENLSPAGVQISQTLRSSPGTPQNALKGLINIGSVIENGTKYNSFYNAVLSQTKWMYPNYSGVINSLEALNLYQITYLVMLSINSTSPFNQTSLFNSLQGQKYHILDNFISFESLSGKTKKNIYLKNFNGNFEDMIYKISETQGKLIRKSSNSIIFSPLGNKNPPPDLPPCGFNNDQCGLKQEILIIIIVSCLISLILIITILVILVRRFVTQKRMNENRDYIVPFNSIKFTNQDVGKSFVMSTTSLKTRSEDKSDTKTHRNITVGVFQQRLVFVKKIRKSFLVMTKDIHAELKFMKDMQDDNITMFCGATIESPNICAIWEYCSKGSLEEIVKKENVNLTMDIILSLITDIVNGMNYITEKIGSHGNLISRNCVINSRWVCKVTNFGLLHVKANEALKEDGDSEAYYQSMLWTSPELLRSDTVPFYGTPKGDVYALGIIISELVTRKSPYADSDVHPKDIVDNIRNGTYPYFRPKIQKGMCSDSLRVLMGDCWSEYAGLRPSWERIRQTVIAINGGKTLNLMDSMLEMMESYASNLEESIQERTLELEDEKKKIDELLQQMLPRSVVDALKKGESIPPMCYDMVTIYFSDIVGFTSLASDSSPFAVVDLLNDLYTTFDQIIDNHDVYKVETIGDAYMVASGLPDLNENRHATAICDMALDIMASLVTFKIRHMPEKQLQLRIGIHSGPCVAGIVGSKMPRYCLFGDTVNTASRYESTSYALRIHLSPTTKKILDEFGGYHTESRGEVTMKGKGTLNTYWLTGKDNYDKALPDLSRAAPLTDHEFK